MFKDAINVESGLINAIVNAGIDIYLASTVIDIVDTSVVNYEHDPNDHYSKTVINVTAVFLERCNRFTLDALHKLQEALESVVALFKPSLDIDIITSRLFFALGTFDFL